MAGSGAAKCGFILLDTLALVLVAVPAILFRIPGLKLPIYQRGFFCYDESLSYPYKDSTVSSAVLYSVGIGLPLILILLTEVTIFAYRRRQDTEYLPPGSFNRCCCDVVIPPLLYQLLKYVAQFFFGLCVTLAVYDISKNVIGRLRPHFFDICQPNFDSFNCTEGLRPLYVEDYECTGDNAHRIEESHRSFPSGHAAVSVYCMLYLTLYLQSRWKWGDTAFLRPLVQFIALLLALYTCLSRVSDYKHHWSDVFGGAVMGAIIAVLVYFGINPQTKDHRSNGPLPKPQQRSGQSPQFRNGVYGNEPTFDS
ncbi:phospholipid phosphatase 1-like isoform X1 [Patiria miniata]|uniref:Phosphatidic acid phosphatase type 2/haloperoxidase domain-containing protein n=1 Tax=Patiria miniata TaxID=46514 RepID=A0A914A6V1_PATMI|nr:phospholipid phosphatase 1-like isoform X1 [Patiria miniata]